MTGRSHARRIKQPMKHSILGLHHVTATVGDAQADLDFCIDTLGLRLVKKTVNFDNHNVYHFYYGNERGSPGTIWTTFPYKGRGVAVGTKGAGQVAVTSFSVPEGSLGFWSTRLRDRGLVVRNGVPRFQEESVAFADPSGLDIELIASRHDDRAPWTSGVVGTDTAIRGLHSITMIVQSPDKTLELLTGLLGFHIVDETERRIRVAAPGEGPGKTIDIVHARGTSPAANGLGTVHHVAMAIADAEAQARLREELVELGYKVTDIMDRQYFRSIYFREPGGVLLEVATVGPGFTLDEDLPCLGRDLKLPPWEEPNRSIIQAALPPVAYR